MMGLLPVVATVVDVLGVGAEIGISLGSVRTQVIGTSAVVAHIFGCNECRGRNGCTVRIKIMRLKDRVTVYTCNFITYM